MAKIIVSEYVTLDGIMEDPGGSPDGSKVAWSFDYWDEDAAKFKFDEVMEAASLLLGRATYEGFAEAWPKYEDEQGFANKMNTMPKYVVSSTLTDPSWGKTTVLNGDLVSELQNLQAADVGPILVAGSAQLVGMLIEHDLVDELRLMIHPVLLGKGKRLFSESSTMRKFSLSRTQTFSKGIVVLTYSKAA